MSSLIVPRTAWSALARPSSLRTATITTTSRSAPHIASPASWTCRTCLRSTSQTRRLPFSTSPRASAGSSSTNGDPRTVFTKVKERRGVAIAAAVLFVAGAGALAFSEDARHFYIGAQRSYRVLTTLGLNIRDYTKSLKEEDWDDPDFQKRMSACHKRCAERTLRTMEKNGSIFIKLGQHLTSLTYLLPEEWCTTFIPLQDKAPVSSYASIEEMVIKDTGKTLEDFFSEFDPKPIGAASLAQVHVARLKDTGEQVAVKVQHPTLDDWAKMDMWLTSFTFKVVKYFFPEYDLMWLSEEMNASLPKELDFREEAKNANRTREYFSKFPDTPLVVPEVRWAERRLLVMEYIAGRRTDDLAYLDSNGISRDEVSAALARIFNEMIFGDDAPLHCDPHGGNLAIRLNPNRRAPHNFDIILYDHGLYRDIPRHLRRAYAHMWLAVLDTDIPAMRKYAWEIAGIGDEDFPIFASAVTGRDYNIVTTNLVKERNAEEKRSMSDALGQDLVQQLVGLLARVPRVILLILKTNDLTRALDENLQTTQGPVRSFMILARYAAHCVFEEELEQIHGSWLWPRNFVAATRALFTYAQVALKLRFYEMYIAARNRLHV